jgi:hypothetical protein
LRLPWSLSLSQASRGMQCRARLFFSFAIHRRIGMSGGRMANAGLRETSHAVAAEEAACLLRHLDEVSVRAAE